MDYFDPLLKVGKGLIPANKIANFKYQAQNQHAGV
jgi:hypothetical protein